LTKTEEKDTITSTAQANPLIPKRFLSKQAEPPLEASDVKRLKQLEIENGRLKKMVADRDLELEVMKEINAKKW